MTALVTTGFAVAAIACVVLALRWAPLWLAAAGLFAGEIGSVSWHDRWHRRRGETVHALWGRDNRNRPAMFGGPDS